MYEVISGRPSARAFDRHDDCFWHDSDLRWWRTQVCLAAVIRTLAGHQGPTDSDPQQTYEASGRIAGWW